MPFSDLIFVELKEEFFLRRGTSLVFIECVL